MLVNRFHRLFTSVVLVALAAAPALAKKTPPEPRFEMTVPSGELLAAPKLAVLPLSVVQEYMPCGDDPVDDYLAATDGLWDTLILARLADQLKSAKLKIEVVPIAPAEARRMLSEVLAAAGIEGFFDPDTGELHPELYERAIQGVAAKVGGPLLAPRLILKSAVKETPWWKRIDGAGGTDIEWDGVERDVESGGAKAYRVLSAFGGTRISVSGTCPVYSLRLEWFALDKRLFWSHGGFDLQSKWAYRLFGQGMKEVSGALGEMFGKKNRDDMEEAVEVALDPLFAK